MPETAALPDPSTKLNVSVVVTVLNEREDIGRMVDSLLGQKPAPAELIVVDGGSSDGTWEWLHAAAESRPGLIAIRDESCNLRNSAGPVSRGRNVAIARASTEVIACADAGCTYGPAWLEQLTAPIREGAAEYALGGSCLAMEGVTVWDLASAPFFGVKLDEAEPTKSCTARSMAFRKELWERIGGFPETVLVGEDTLFDHAARRLTQPAFVQRAKAMYRPQYTLGTALGRTADYAMSDGIIGLRAARLFRNGARCGVEVLALVALRWTVIPLLLVLVLEVYFAMRLDGRSLLRRVHGVGDILRILIARLVFSLLVPWIVAANQIRGAVTKRPMSNRQNQ